MTVEAETAEAAAAWLDGHWPREELGDWWAALDLDRLDLESPCRCVCGQLGAALAEHEGFEVDQDREWILLPAAAAAAAEGHYSVSGYMILAHYLDWWSGEESDPAAWELSDRVRKHLGAEEMPEAVEAAFDGSVPTEAWLAAIERRRRGG